MTNEKHTSWSTEFGASIGVMFVAIPLSLGIALASGVPPATALLTGVIGGIVVGLFSGAPLVVSGPAAGLAALILHYVQVHGLVGMAVITVLAGVIQLVVAWMRAGVFFKWVPESVLTGMLAAIGILIGVGQLFVLAGVSAPGTFVQNMAGLPSLVGDTLTSSTGLMIAGLGAVGIAIMAVWPRLPKLKAVPAVIVSVLAVTLLSLGLEMPRLELAQLGDVVTGRWSDLASLSWLPNWQALLVPAMVLAAVGAAESLLTARAVDELRRQRGDKAERSDLNRELMAQGLGNTASGLLGGIPLTGVIVRSGANIQFGAKTRWSTVLHGVWLLIIMLALVDVMEYIPLTALAAILVVTSYKLVNPKQIAERARKSRPEFILWSITCVGILLTDLLIGLGMGLVAAFVMRRKTATVRLQKTAKIVRARRVMNQRGVA